MRSGICIQARVGSRDGSTRIRSRSALPEHGKQSSAWSPARTWLDSDYDSTSMHAVVRWLFTWDQDPRRSRRQPLALSSDPNQVGPAPNIELFHHSSSVLFHNRHAQVKVSSNLGIGVAVSEPLRDCQFLCIQLFDTTSLLRRCGRTA